ncbi:MAG TPA: DUF1820 family protein [Vicinamibacteria bacterium]|nr:DUF1820 family protein [Vicinamibacteria bacterium]
MPERERSLYKVSFLSQGQVYELYARKVAQGGLLGFVEVEGVVFGQKTTVVVDPSEERLKIEFEGVRRFYVPIHSVLRIDEVDKPGPSRISEASKGSNVAAFPMPMFKPPRGES